MIVPWKKQAYDHPDRIWIRISDQQITYKDLANRILLYAITFEKIFRKVLVLVFGNKIQLRLLLYFLRF